MKGAKAFFAVLVLAVAAGAAWYFMRPMDPGAEPFVGTWVNVDEKTGGITRVVIKPARGGLDVQMWGRCRPQDCDWGRPESAQVKASPSRVDLVWRPRFAERNQSIERLADGRLRVVTHTRFTDRSKRPDYTSREVFRAE